MLCYGDLGSLYLFLGQAFWHRPCDIGACDLNANASCQQYSEETDHGWISTWRGRCEVQDAPKGGRRETAAPRAPRSRGRRSEAPAVACSLDVPVSIAFTTNSAAQHPARRSRSRAAALQPEGLEKARVQQEQHGQGTVHLQRRSRSGRRNSSLSYGATDCEGRGVSYTISAPCARYPARLPCATAS